MISELHWLRGHILLNEEQLSSLKGLMIALMKMRVNEIVCFGFLHKQILIMPLLKKNTTNNTTTHMHTYRHTHTHCCLFKTSANNLSSPKVVSALVTNLQDPEKVTRM